jgi:hypothetical protein
MASWDHAFDRFRRRGCAIEPGLSDDELARAEALCEARFPPDLAGLLREGLPVGSRFPDWRRLPDDVTGRAWVLEGILSDVEDNRFWLEGWGVRPADAAEALSRAAAELARAPRLIRVFGHRFLPAEPHEAGNPVLSVYGTDVIVYGDDLASWVDAEFSLVPGTISVGGSVVASAPLPAMLFPEPGAVPGVVRPIRFWSELLG